MIRIRPAQERGHADFGWLDSRHTFSFGSYYDPEHLGFRSLRVINDDRVAAGAGFAEHGHRDMEIISYVLDGQLAHGDSLGNGSVLRAGDVQRITAGSGILHTERNPSSTEGTHFLQIWIEPNQTGLEPSYEERHLSPGDLQGRLVRIASGTGQEDALAIHQDVELFAARLAAGEAVDYSLATDRYAWIQLARGAAKLNGTPLQPGDGAAISNQSDLRFEGVDEAEVLVFDLG